MAERLKGFMKQWIFPPGISAILGSLLYRLPVTETRDAFVTKEDALLLSANTALKERHRGERCFVLGAGSSVKRQDLKKLAGEYVISVSNTFVHPDFPVFSPRYHVLSPIIRSHGRLHSEEKFVKWLRGMEAKTHAAEMFFHIGDKAMVDENGLFRGRTIHWVDYCHWDERSTPEMDLARIPEIWSVSETALTVALYLGFEKIYMLGFDHDWFNGLYVYFFDEKKEHALQPDASDAKLAFVDSEFQMRRHAYIFKKYKYLYGLKKNIFNANADPNSYVDVFPKVDYASLFPDENRVISQGEGR